MSSQSTAPGFAQDIQPLFRESDREAMDYIFDLWSYQDVSAHADAILERLEDGTMPCDEAWPEERIELFRSWLAGGKLA
jgi:hypothetical protein